MKWPALHLQSHSRVHPQSRPHSGDCRDSRNTDPWPGLGHHRPLKRRMGLQLAHGAGEPGPAVRQVSILRSPSSPVSQSASGSPADAPTLAALPAPALQEEWVVELQRVWDTEVHGHVLDVLGPVCSVGPQLLHLRVRERQCSRKYEPVLSAAPPDVVRICVTHVSHLSAGPLRQHPQPVAYHGENGGKVGETKHYPQQHQQLEERALTTSAWAQRDSGFKRVLMCCGVSLTLHRDTVVPFLLHLAVVSIQKSPGAGRETVSGSMTPHLYFNITKTQRFIYHTVIP